MLSEIHASKNQPIFDTFAQVQPIVEGHIKAFLDACHPERGVEGAKDMAPDLINHQYLIDEKKKILEYNIKIRIPNWLDYFLAMPVLLYRRIRFGYTFRRIPLTKGKFAIVDPDDYPRLRRDKWNIYNLNRKYYAKRKIAIDNNSKYITIYMHRLIINVPDGLFVDHINNNGLDNRKANLRLATRAQNSCNVKKPKNRYSSNYKGLYYNRNEQKWRARITTNDKTIYLGDFEDEIEAAKTYDKAAKKYQGEFAVFNFPELATDSIEN